MTNSEMPKIKLDEVLQYVGKSLRQQRFETALLALQKLLQAGMAQQFPAMLQRYIAELVFECLEQAGEDEAALEYCQRAIAEYESQINTSQASHAVENDLAMLKFRRICLLVKLDQHEEARRAVKDYQHSSSPQGEMSTEKVFTRILKYSKATRNQLLREQKRMGSFQLTQQLIVSG